MAVDVTTGTSLRIGAPRMLFQERFLEGVYDVHPDGRFLLVRAFLSSIYGRVVTARKDEGPALQQRPSPHRGVHERSDVRDEPERRFPVERKDRAPGRLHRAQVLLAEAEVEAGGGHRRRSLSKYSPRPAASK